MIFFLSCQVKRVVCYDQFGSIGCGIRLGGRFLCLVSGYCFLKRFLENRFKIKMGTEEIQKPRDLFGDVRVIAS